MNYRTHIKELFIKRYEEGSDRWTQLKKEEEVYPQIQVMKRLFPSSETFKILDIGCGTLSVSLQLLKEFPNANIHGIDIAFDSILKKYPDLFGKLDSHLITYEKADFFQFTSKFTYDMILDIGLFHHVVPTDWQDYIKQINCLLKDKGSLFLHAYHLTDGIWNKPSPGGHFRKGGCYYHYLDLFQLKDIFKNIFHQINEIGRYSHEEHIIGIYHLMR